MHSATIKIIYSNLLNQWFLFVCVTFKPSEMLFTYIFLLIFFLLVPLIYIHCHISSVACIKKICFSWNLITVYWNLRHFLYIIILRSFNYMCGFSFGYYTHIYFLYVCIDIFSVVYHINYVSLIVHDHVICIDICDFKTWPVFFT